ncbi:hypothetical protein D9M73_186540 [compost metagenome]
MRTLGVCHFSVLGDLGTHVGKVFAQACDVRVDPGDLRLSPALVDFLVGDVLFDLGNLRIVIIDHLLSGRSPGDHVLRVLFDVAVHLRQAGGGVGVLGATLIQVIVRAHGHATRGNTGGDDAHGFVAAVGQRASEDADTGADGAGLVTGLAEELCVIALGQARVGTVAFAFAQHGAAGVGATAH